jgi:ribonuclease HI
LKTLFDNTPVQATLFADGGSRGNPGPAASGSVIIAPEGTVMREIGRFLGVATNNVAEWNALCFGLEAALEMDIRRLAIRLDSELVVKQMTGEYRVKHPDLQPLHRRAQSLFRKFEYVDIRHVPREQNTLADRLANHVLDRQATAVKEGAYDSKEPFSLYDYDSVNQEVPTVRR